MLPFLPKNALALPFAEDLLGGIGIDITGGGCSARYHDPRRPGGWGEGVREREREEGAAGRLAEGEKFNTARPGEEMTSQIRGRMPLNGLCDDGDSTANILVVDAAAAAGQPDEVLEANVARRELLPIPDNVRLPMGYAPGIGVLVEN